MTSNSREITAEAARRRTFAIISHPDAGKTTLTEKFLLYSGAVLEAGSVKARAGRRSATSDWMAMEQERGISITSTVLQFNYRNHVLNLLDTPGHRDFSEDTYRVLAAADAAIMVLDAAKGIEEQTLKLFQVCRSRSMPIITFINKYDRPGLDPLALIDEIEDRIHLAPTPVTWPVGLPGEFAGVVERASGAFVEYSRTAHGSRIAAETRITPEIAAQTHGDTWTRAVEEVALLDAVGAEVERESFLAGRTTPVFFGSALTNFGVRHILDAVVDLAPGPTPRSSVDGDQRPLDAGFSAFAFKVQANMDPAHRDRVAFVRICSGHFERGMTVTHEPTGRPFATKYAASVFGAERDTINDAFPGDVIALVNANDVRIGDSLFHGDPVRFPPIESFAPELFADARPRDISRSKQFRRGLEQLGEEGVVQVLYRRGGDRNPVLAAVGQMQFEVFAHRLEHEFGAPIDVSAVRRRIARRTDAASVAAIGSLTGVEILERPDGTLLALFESPYWLERVVHDHPDWLLDPILTGSLPVRIR